MKRACWQSQVVVVSCLLSSASACTEESADAESTEPELDSSVRGRTYYWTDWTSFRFAADAGVRGSIALPTGSIAIQYDGPFYGAQVEAGPEWWKPDTPYRSPIVDNAPESSDLIKVQGGNAALLRLTFEKPVTNPVLAITSLGNPDTVAVTTFDTPFEIISQGRGMYGMEPLTQPAENRVRGRESYGVLLFRGTHTSIGFTAEEGETMDGWYGMTVGVPDPNDGWDAGGVP
jgi:hypothetical protein